MVGLQVGLDTADEVHGLALEGVEVGGQHPALDPDGQRWQPLDRRRHGHWSVRGRLVGSQILVKLFPTGFDAPEPGGIRLDPARHAPVGRAVGHREQQLVGLRHQQYLLALRHVFARHLAGHDRCRQILVPLLMFKRNRTIHGQSVGGYRQFPLTVDVGEQVLADDAGLDIRADGCLGGVAVGQYVLLEPLGEHLRIAGVFHHQQLRSRNVLG